MQRGSVFIAERVEAALQLMAPDGFAAGVDQALLFRRDAAQGVALEFNHDRIVCLGLWLLLLGFAWLARACAGPDQLAVGVVAVAFLVLAAVVLFCTALDQAAGFVVAVAALLAAVLAFDQLACRVVAVALGAAIEVDLFDQPVHDVVAKAGVAVVLVGEHCQPPGPVVAVMLGQTALAEGADLAPLVALEADLAAIGQADADQIAGFVQAVAGFLGGGVKLGCQAALAVVLALLAQAFFAFDGNQLAPAVVTVAGAAGLAVAVARYLAGLVPLQFLDAAFGVFDFAGLLALLVAVAVVGALAQGVGLDCEAAQVVVLAAFAHLAA